MEEWLKACTPDILRQLLNRKGSTFSDDLGRSALGVTRCEFLVGVGVTTASSAAAGEEPEFIPEADTLRIHYLGSDWRIAPKSFGPNARCLHIPQPGGNAHRLLLQDARFPGARSQRLLRGQHLPAPPKLVDRHSLAGAGIVARNRIERMDQGHRRVSRRLGGVERIFGEGGCQIRPASADGDIGVNQAFAIVFDAPGGLQLRAKDILVTADRAKLTVDDAPKIPGPAAAGALATQAAEM